MTSGHSVSDVASLRIVCGMMDLGYYIIILYALLLHSTGETNRLSKSGKVWKDRSFQIFPNLSRAGEAVYFSCDLHNGAMREGTANACYGQGPCSRHDLACGRNSRLAIISAVHGFKKKESLCPSLAINHCQFNTKFCCKEDPVFDCTYPFKNVYMRSLYEQCSGRRNCSYYTDRVQDVCSLSTKTLSSFSSIKFSCIEDTEVVQFGTEGSTRGNSVYAVFDPERFHHVPDPVLYYFCRVLPTSSSVPVNISINAIDIRLDKTTKGQCSSLQIRHKGDHIVNITCAQYYKRTFLSSVSHLDTILTPVDLILTVVEKNMPGYVWIQVENEQEDLTLSCGYLQDGWWQDEWPSETGEALSTADTSAVVAVAGGVVVISVLATVLVAVVWWKRRARVTKYLQTIPLSASCSKSSIERRLRAQSGGSEMFNLTVEIPEADTSKGVTLQVRPPGTPPHTSAHAQEPIYDRIKFADDNPTVSAVGVYDHLRHVIVEKDKDEVEGYDKCAVGMVKVDKDASAYDTPESASRDSDDVIRNIAYDHLHGNKGGNSVTHTIYENPSCEVNGQMKSLNDDGDEYEPTSYK